MNTFYSSGSSSLLYCVEPKFNIGNLYANDKAREYFVHGFISVFELLDTGASFSFYHRVLS